MTAKTCGHLVGGDSDRPCLLKPRHKGQHVDAVYREAKNKRNRRHYASHAEQFHDRRLTNYDRAKNTAAARDYRARLKTYRQEAPAMLRVNLGRYKDTLRKLAVDDGVPMALVVCRLIRDEGCRRGF